MIEEVNPAISPKEIEKLAGISLIPRYRERVCLIFGFILGATLALTIWWVFQNPTKGFDQFKKPVFYYDICVDVFIILEELYSLSIHHGQIIFCFPALCFPKCVLADWLKALWYFLLAAPNIIWCRHSTYAIIIMLQIAGVGVVYFINMLVVSVYVQKKLRDYEEKVALLDQDKDTPTGTA